MSSTHPNSVGASKNKDSGYLVGLEIFSEFFTALCFLKMYSLIDEMRQRLLYLVSGISVLKMKIFLVAEVLQ